MTTTLQITSLSHDGRGIARDDEGVACFVAGALPGETVTAKVLVNKRNLREMQTVKVLEASPQRVAPTCEYYGRCGGCQLQHCAAPAQIELKQQIMLEQIQRLGKIQPVAVLPPVTSPALGYRRRARLAARWDAHTQSLALGFREEGDNAIVNIDHCAVLEPELSALIVPLREMLLACRFGRRIGHLELAAGDKTRAILLRVMEPLLETQTEVLLAFAAAQHVGVWVQEAEHAPRWLAGIGECSYALQQKTTRIRFHPGDFFQGNRVANEGMVNAVIEALSLKKTDNVVEFFAGLGNFTLPIAHHACHVLAFEGDEALVALANLNAQHNGVTNVVVRDSDLAKLPPEALRVPCHKVLLDPPRAGAQELCAQLGQLKAEKIVYVSCNPAALARDAALLLTQGYTMQSLRAVDMFPQTTSMECIAEFVFTGKPARKQPGAAQQHRRQLFGLRKPALNKPK